jgi:transcription elongation factor SPT4
VIIFLSRSAQRVYGVDKYARGLYAITVKGRIPDDVEQELESQGIKYRPRDQTEVD